MLPFGFALRVPLNTTFARRRRGCRSGGRGSGPITQSRTDPEPTGQPDHGDRLDVDVLAPKRHERRLTGRNGTSTGPADGDALE
jgi:hypothetical protein